MSYAISSDHLIDGKIFWEIVVYIEKLGHVPLLGSGPWTTVTLRELTDGKERWEIPQIPLCTNEERDAFMQRHFPYCYEAEEAARNESLDSAAL